MRDSPSTLGAAASFSSGGMESSRSPAAQEVVGVTNPLRLATPVYAAA